MRRTVHDRVTRPQIDVIGDADEHVSMFSRSAMRHLTQAAGLRVLELRFHHSGVYDYPLFRSLGLDDGYRHLLRA